MSKNYPSTSYADGSRTKRNKHPQVSVMGCTFSDDHDLDTRYLDEMLSHYLSEHDQDVTKTHSHQ